MSEHKKSINQWAEEDRPREKLLLHGVHSLSTAELLAIIIGSGSHDESAVQLMQRIMDDCNNQLSTLAKMDIHDLCSYKGIGPAKAISIIAASELGKRRQDEPSQARKRILSSEDTYQYFYPLLCDAPVEECWVLLLNQSSYVIGAVRISQGGIASTLVDVRCVMREAILRRATALILCHNHPSGSITPSTDDDRMTASVCQAGKAVNIRVLDHLIITDGKYYSYNDEGKIN